MTQAASRNLRRMASDWLAPLGSHPSAVSPHQDLPKWIQKTYQGLNPQTHSGHAFLYNISLETLAPKKFRSIWIPIYGKNTGISERNFFDAIHIVIPYHKASKDKEKKTNGRVSTGVTDTQKPSRIAEWLNCRPLLDLYDALHDPSYEGDKLLIQRIMEKTWISFVEAKDQSANEKRGEAEGEYAIAIYFALKRMNEIDENDVLLRGMLENADVSSRTIQELVKSTRVLLGSGIDEPFSLRGNDGYYSYSLLLSFASRAHFIPKSSDCCVLKRHLSVIGRLWSNRSGFPIPAGRCEFIERNTEILRDREMRLDAFLLWAKHALNERISKLKRAWVINSNLSSYAIEQGEKNSFCSRYPAWEPQFNRIKRTKTLLSKSELLLNNYELIPGSLYCRRQEIVDELKTYVVIPILNLLERSKWVTPMNSAFFITAAQGGGKSQLKKKLKEYLAPLRRKRKLYISDIEPPLLKNASELIKEVVAARNRTIPTIIFCDEFQKCEQFSKFANNYYTDFDVDLINRLPVVGVFLTSEFQGDSEQLSSWLKDTKGCRPDFVRRANISTLPSWDVEDELIIIAASVLDQLRQDEFSIEKDALAFLLIDQPYKRDTLVNRVLDVVRRLGPSHTTLRLRDFPIPLNGPVSDSFNRFEHRLSEMKDQGSGFPWKRGDLILIRYTHLQK